MDDRSVCTPLTVESDAPNNTTSSPNAASVTYADKVINTKIDITQVEGDKSEEELLKDLLTDEYCHVCEAVLLFESQRLSHYEGKRHAQKVKVYLQAKRAEKANKDSTGPQWTMTTDKDRFCELCNMVFSSHVVARSHYEGKVHTKNLRKQGLHPPERNTDVHTLQSLAQDPDNSEQKSSPEGGTEHVLDSAATTTTSSTEVDLKDPDKYCALCAASFNNPQMALQHYNGRKHQRNQARQELLRELGDDAQQAESLMCQMCSLQFNSVEMYQAHMQGNKHQIREKKVVDLCKSQHKVYGTFADELADYIQVQKARGIKTNQVVTQGDTQREGEDDEEDDWEVLNEGDMMELNKLRPNLPPTSTPPHLSRPGSYYPAEMCHPSYQGPPWASHGWSHNYPPPVLPHSGNPQFTSRPIKRRRHRKQSSSSSYSTSSSYSSYSSSSSSSTSDSDGSEYRRREKKRTRRSRRERGRRGRDVESDQEERRRRKRRRREKVSEERRREQSVESEEEGRRKKLKSHGKHRRKEKRIRKENFEVEREERVTDKLKPEDVMENRKETELHIQAGIDVEREDGQDEAVKPKFRKDKKKTKDKVDTRTEEEKLWDDSILGC